MTEEEEVEGGERLPQRDIEDIAEMKSWGEQERDKKERNTHRIFLGVSQLISSLGFERKMGGKGL